MTGEEFRKLRLPVKELPDGYAMTPWHYYAGFAELPFWRAVVWKLVGNTGVKAPVTVTIDDVNYAGDHLDDLVRVRLEVAYISCLEFIAAAESRARAAATCAEAVDAPTAARAGQVPCEDSRAIREPRAPSSDT